MANHRWSESDDLVALYVYRFGVERLGTTVLDLARLRGIKPGSVRMRVQNFRALDGKGGLENWADQSEHVFRRHAKTDEANLRRLIDHPAHATKS